ncbi:MAG: DUF1722 domain-containing protein [Candidatus Zixiibacteriota bacterium]|nr:MAG: DUF1722 domain-containing protein [candidate division Zixibacteria bacterium]
MKYKHTPKESNRTQANMFINSGQQHILSKWLECKYSLLERSPEIYTRIHTLLQGPITNKTICQIYFGIEAALYQTPKIGCRVSAALHVWGKLKGKAKNGDKLHFFYFLDAFRRRRITIRGAKRILYRLAQKQRNEELLNSRYFEELKERNLEASDTGACGSEGTRSSPIIL